jgi:hypothetical protein
VTDMQGSSKASLRCDHTHNTFAAAAAAAAQNGNIKKGPVGVGVRIQENMRVGPLKVEAVAAQVRVCVWRGGMTQPVSMIAFSIVWGGGKVPKHCCRQPTAG